MAEILPMLALSPTMEEGVIARWAKAEGDDVASGDVLCEVETDKAVMDYESTVEGKLLKILAGEGDACAIGEPIAIVGAEGEDIEGLIAEAQSQREGKAKPAKKKEKAEAEQAGEGEQEAEAEGEQAKKEEKEKQKKEEPTKPAGPSAEELARAREAAGAQQRAQQRAPGGAPLAGVKASPLARKLAAEAGLDLRRISGSGPDGRVVKRDVEAAAAAGVGVKPAAVSAGAAAELPAGAVLPPVVTLTDEAVKVSPMRKTIAQRLSESKFSAPHYYLTIAIAMDEILEARRQLNAQLAGKVSLNAFLMKMAAMALARHPVVNATWGGETIQRHGRVDIGLAVALDDGLVAPVVRDCLGKGVIAIDRDLQPLIAKARAGKLTPQDYAEATFTVSNLGNYGIDEFTAIINPPGSAILAVGQIARTPVVDEDDELTIRSMMKVTLSCDHRVIDGAEGAAFLRDFKAICEAPVRALY